MRCLAFSACLLAALAARVQADPLSGSFLPEGAHWVMHVDVDAARAAGPLWELARNSLWETHRADFEPKLAMIERATGMKREQLHDVTLFGQSFDPASACLRIHAPMDKDNLASALHLDPSFTQIDHGGHDVFSWMDRTQGVQLYAGFDARKLGGAANTWVIVSHDLDAVKAALDAQDGKHALMSDSPLLPPAQSPTDPAKILWLAARDLSELPRAQQVESPLLAQLSAASLSVHWADNRAVTELRLEAKSEQSAQQLQAVAEGVKAFVALSAADEHAPPRLKLFSSALQQLNIRAQGTLLKGDWPLDTAKIENLLNMALQPTGANAAPVLP